MNGHATQWAPGLVALAAGLLIGFLLLRRSLRSAGGDPPLGPTPGGEARARYAALVEQLHDLEDNASQREPVALARERYRLELAAAATLLEQEAAPRLAEAPPVPAPRTATGGRPALRGFLWGAGSVAALALLGIMVSRQASERREGGSLTGNVPGEQTAGGEPAELGALQAQVAARPDDVDARLALALAHLRRRELMAVFEHTQYVLERQPRHPQALSYQALVRLAMGQAEAAETMLQTAIAEDADSLDARLHLGLVYMQQGRTAEAEASLAEAMRRHPEQRDSIAGLLAQMRERMAQGPGRAGAAMSGGEDPHASVPAPQVTTTATAPGAVPADGVGLTITLGPGIAARGVLFVVARAAGQSGGAPLAARRLQALAFPLPVVLTASDSMMGQPLPESLQLEARLDRDGDPSTRDPGDPVARRDGVRRGSRDTRLELRTP